MPTDPGHEFPDVLRQLCGPAATYQSGGPYPPSTTVDSSPHYVASGGQDPGEIMKCYLPQQLPVQDALAREFVVCDNWHASMPGPTWPNRMFVHAASSRGLDHSPTTAEIAEWEAIDGLSFRNGTIFDALQTKGIQRRLYGGDDFRLSPHSKVSTSTISGITATLPLISPRRTIRMVISSSNRVTTYYTITKTAPLNIPWRMRLVARL